MRSVQEREIKLALAEATASVGGEGGALTVRTEEVLNVSLSPLLLIAMIDASREDPAARLNGLAQSTLMPIVHSVVLVVQRDSYVEVDDFKRRR